MKKVSGFLPGKVVDHYLEQGAGVGSHQQVKLFRLDVPDRYAFLPGGFQIGQGFLTQ